MYIVHSTYLNYFANNIKHMQSIIAKRTTMDMSYNLSEFNVCAIVYLYQ